MGYHVWCVAHGVWRMAHAVSCELCSAWCMAHGACCMMCAVWRMVCGVCCMMCAVWRMVYYDVWRMVYGAWYVLYDVCCVAHAGAAATATHHAPHTIHFPIHHYIKVV